MSRRLLVTGGAGFIGANFCHYWAETYPEETLVVLDALSYAGNVSNLTPLVESGRVQFAHGDIGDEELVLELLRSCEIDTVVNFAAESHVDRSIHGPAIFVQTNVLGTLTLLEAARVWSKTVGARGCRLHHVSTDEVYGSLTADEPGFTEDTRYAPNSPYAASKAGADHLVHAYGCTYGLSYTLSNCSNNYGPYQFPEKLLPLCIVNLLEGRPLPIYGNGLQVRDWLHVADHCRAIDLILASSPSGESWNIGGGTELPNLAVVEALCDAMDAAFAEDSRLAPRFPNAPPAQGQPCRTRISFVQDRPGHDRRYAVDGRKLERRLGFRTQVPFVAGLSGTINWYLSHEPWWRAVMDGSYRQWIDRQYASRIGQPS